MGDGREERFMFRHRFNTLAKAAVMIGLITMVSLFTGVLEAGTTVVDPTTGYLLIVDVFIDPVDQSVQGIRFRERSPQLVTTTEELIPNTYDSVLDESPAIALNPAGGVVVVWSRDDGSDFELLLSKRANDAWSPNHVLTFNSSFDTEPRVLVDSAEVAHVVWWGDGEGGPVHLRSYDVFNGSPIGPLHNPLESAMPRPRRFLDPSGPGDPIDPMGQGGVDEPGGPATSGPITASANPCASNPAAGPEHGVVLSCGQPAAYQVSDCQLVVGVLGTSTNDWHQTMADLSTANLSTTSVREIVQSIADYQCN